MVRSKAQDGQPAMVSVEQLAYGLHAMDVPVWESHDREWRRLEHGDRDEYLARARFVLGIAESTPQVSFSAEPRRDPIREGVLPTPRPIVIEDGMQVRGAMPQRPQLGSAPHPVQLGDQRAECTCGRWQFEDVPEPAKHISGCAVTQMVPWGPS